MAISTPFAITLGAAPLLNTSDFRSSFGGPDGSHLPLDAQGLLRTVESVALPRTKLAILGRTEHPHILRVATTEYPGEVFVDERFIQPVEGDPQERSRELPSVPDLIAALEELVGTAYIWGGNWPQGIPSLMEYYPPGANAALCESIISATWQLKGVDCSGLLYYATNGVTPRNTSDLIDYGQPVDIENKGVEEIVRVLNDLDLIVWKGHVVIVLSPQSAIEGFVGKGVIITPLVSRIEEILQTRAAVNDYPQTAFLGDRFVVRRWHPDCLADCQ